jgi:hypothetical protein
LAEYLRLSIRGGACAALVTIVGATSSSRPRIDDQNGMISTCSDGRQRGITAALAYFASDPS